MMTDRLYQRLRANNSRPASWALKKIFEHHTGSTSESLNARRCADIMREIGTERFSLLRQWVPIELPETLNARTLERLRNNLETILTWEKTNPPSPA